MCSQAAISHSQPRLNAQAVVQRLLGALLLFAAAAKLHDDLYRDSWNTLAAISTVFATLELLLAIAMLSYAWPTLSWRAAAVAFGTFAFVSLARFLRGFDDCGCFGPFSVRPLFSLGLDLAAVAALLSWPPPQPGVPKPLRKLTTALVLFALLATIFLGGYRYLGSHSTVVHGAEAIVPADWINQRLPSGLVASDLDQQIRSGDWLVLMHRHDCDACTSLVESYLEAMERRLPEADQINVLFVEVPPYTGSAVPQLPLSRGHNHARLLANKSTFIATPAQLFIRDGIVMRVELDPSSNLLHERCNRNREATSPKLSSLSMIAPATLNMQPNASVERASATVEYEGWLPDYRFIRDQHLFNEVACGPRSLLTVLRSLGIAINEADERTILSAAGTSGIDMLSLKKLAEDFGVYAKGIQASISTLRKLGLPAVVHLRSAGFAAVTSYTPHAVQVIYPPSRKVTLNDEELAEAYGPQGFALIMSTSPIPDANIGASEALQSATEQHLTGLTTSSSMLAIGRIHKTSWEGRLTISNDTGREIALIAPAVSCSCMTAQLEQSRLQHKESTVLHVQGRQSAWGSFNHSILIRTAEQEAIQMTIPIHGFLESSCFFDRPIVSLRGIFADDTAEVSVPFELPDSIDIAEVVASSYNDAPVALKIIRDSARGRPCLVIDWLGSSKAGWHNFRIDLGTPSIADSPSTPAWLAVEVVPRVEAQPPSLLIQRCDFERSWSRTVAVQINDPEVLKSAVSFDWSDPAFETAIAVSAAPANTFPTKLTFTPKGDAKENAEILSGRSAKLNVHCGNVSTTIQLFFGENAFQSAAQTPYSDEALSAN